MSDYVHSTGDLAEALGCHRDTIRHRAKALGLGIDLGGSAGFRFSDADKAALIESMRPAAKARDEEAVA